jgi:hypothetical protein
VIFEHEEPWWNDIDREQLLTCPPEILQSHQQSFSSKQDEWANEVMHMALRSIFIHAYQVIFTFN